MNKGKGNPADLLNGTVAAGQQNRPDGSGSCKGGKISGEKFSAPDLSVCSQSGAVPDNAETGRIQPVVRHTGRHVSPVVLDFQKGNLPFSGGTDRFPA